MQQSPGVQQFCDKRLCGHSACTWKRALERGWHRRLLTDLEGRPTGRGRFSRSARTCALRCRAACARLPPSAAVTERLPRPSARAQLPRLAGAASHAIPKWAGLRGACQNWPGGFPAARSGLPAAGASVARFRGAMRGTRSSARVSGKRAAAAADAAAAREKEPQTPPPVKKQREVAFELAAAEWKQGMHMGRAKAADVHGIKPTSASTLNHAVKNLQIAADTRDIALQARARRCARSR